MQKESARDASFQFFKFISPTIDTCARRKHDLSLTYNYKEMYDLSSYKWKRFKFFKVILFISCHTTIGVLHGVPSSIANCTLEALRSRSRFWDHIFPETEFAKNDIVHGSIDWISMTSSFEEGGIEVGSQGSGSNKIRIRRLVIKISRLTLSVVD